MAKDITDDSADEGLQPPPKPSLRQRKKAAAMRRIQAVALKLFAEHGFDNVTIEQVAEAAEASPSSVYRYFQTKGGLVLYDEFDDRVLSGFAHYLQQGLEPWEALMTAFGQVEAQHFGIESEATRERIRLFFEQPSVRATGMLMVDGLVEQLAETIAGTGRWNIRQGRLIASSIIWPFVAFLRNWYETGEPEWRHLLEEAVETLKNSAPK